MTDAERIEQLERENRALREENRLLREELEKLRKEIEQWRRGFRERPKRRTSRAEGRRAPTGKRPGRAAGHAPASRPVPSAVDGEVAHPAPSQCTCGGAVVATDETRSTIIEDIPVVAVTKIRHVARVGCCAACGKKVSAPLPGDTPSGQSIAKTQLGPNLQALIASLRFDHHLPLPQVCAFVRTWFGVSVTRGGLAHLLARLATRAEPSLAEITEHVRSSKVVGADETGLRQNGAPGYTWLVRTAKASLFRSELSRGAWVLESMLGSDFDGVLTSDFYSVYTSAKNGWTPAYCGAHAMREAKKIAEVWPCTITAEFADGLRTWYRDAQVAQASGDHRARHGIRVRLGKLIADPKLAVHREVARLQNRLDEHFHGVLTFLDRPDIPADNNATERDIRCLAQHRKSTGGTRSPRGSRVLDVMMSVTQTARKNGGSTRSYILQLHDAHLHRRSPPTLFTS